FYVWASYLGVFARSNASLDRRLKDHDEIQQLVIRLLSLIDQNLRWGMFVLSRCGRALNIQGTSKDALDAVESSIDRLDHLGVTIRQYSTAGLSARVIAFAAKNHDPAFEELALRMQLARSISRRRQRLKYIMQHQEKLAERDLDHDHSPAHPPLGPIVDVVDSGKREKEPRNAKTVKFHMPAESTTPAQRTGDDIRSETHASTFRATPSRIARLREEDSRSEGAKSTTTFAANDEDNYPEPPVKKDGGPDPICDYCNRRLKKADLGKRAWQHVQHWEHDIEPYVCISEECSDRPPFRNLQDWRTHMTQAHSPSWTSEIHRPLFWSCDIDHDDVLDFQNKVDFDAHLKACHGEHYMPSDLPAITEMCETMRPRPPYLCPLCGSLPEKLTAR
ncbi:hypothetical protein QBC46DRAFT_421041, partial [Diplogelasinospora grovesii]